MEEKIEEGISMTDEGIKNNACLPPGRNKSTRNAEAISQTTLPRSRRTLLVEDKRSKTENRRRKIEEGRLNLEQ